MRNRKFIKFLAAATATALLTTSILPQGMVYASAVQPEATEAVGQEESTEVPQEETVEATEAVTEMPETELSTEKETKEPQTELSTEKEMREPQTELSTEKETKEPQTELSTQESAGEEGKKISKAAEKDAASKKRTAEELEEEDEITDVEAEEEAESTGVGAKPAVGEIVTKHTINVEPDNPESENTAGKDTKWKLKWQDEFDTGKLDMSKWDYQAGDGSNYGVAGWGNSEKEYYTDGNENGSNNISFDDEHLIITAKKETTPGYATSYTSGKLWTKGDAYYNGETEEPLFATKYGRIEAKLTLPAGTGYWPAFWMMPLDDKYGGWASSGELDIMEARGRVTNSVDGTIHFGNAWPNNKSRGGQYDSNKTSDKAQNFDFTQEHEYAVEWLPGVIKWYVDDECYYTATNWYSTKEGNGDNFTYPAPYDQDFFIMLNLAVGGNYDGDNFDDSINGGQMKVDYVRVYDLCNEDGSMYDYSQDEKTVTPASSSSTGSLVGGEVNVTNFLSGDLSKAHVSVQDSNSVSGDTPLNKGWYLLTGTGGAATVTAAEEGAKVNITAPGANGYSIQLMHQLPLTQGYEYELTFEAKADNPKNITAQMSDYVYTNFIGSWAKYSDAFPAALTRDWKTYTFRFNMTEGTDDATRLELNLGAGTTDAVYFRNASLKAVGIYEGPSEDSEKEPLKGGEHIYNGTFDQGNNQDENKEYTRFKFWDTIGTVTAKVDKDTRKLHVSGTSNDAGIEQKNVQLLGKDGYQIFFDASVAAARNIIVKVIGNDGTVYENKSIALSAGDNQKSFEFTVPETAVERYGRVQFIVGTGAEVVLDNISMKRLTNYNVDYSNTKVYPLANGTFANGMQGWNIFNETGADMAPNVSNGVCSVTARNTGVDTWKMMLIADPIQITEGLNYTLQFDVKANKAGQPVTAKIETTDGSYHALCNQDFETTLEWKTYKVDFTADREGSMEFKFILGSVKEETVVSVRNISLCVANTPVMQAPDLDLSGMNYLGNDVAIPITNYYKFEGVSTETKYLSAVKKAIITDPNKKRTTVTPRMDAGKLVIRGDAFESDGMYDIRIEVDGFDFTDIQIPVYPNDGNLILNGQFTNGLSSWGSYFNAGEGTAAGSITVPASKEVRIDFAWADDFWDLQMAQTGIPTEKDAWYVVKADIRSTIDRPFRINFADSTGGNSTYEIFKAGNKYTTYTFYCKAGTDESKLEFFFGRDESIGAYATPNASHQIFIDNVYVRKLTAADESAVVPTLKSKGAVKLGNDVTLELSGVQNAWSVASKQVIIDGMYIQRATVEGNTVTIPADVFVQSGYKEIVIRAEGFRDTNVVYQRILSPGVQDYIENGSFANGGSGWTIYQLEQNNGGVTYEDGKAIVAVDYTSYGSYDGGATITPASWTTMLSTQVTDLEIGVGYTLMFKAKTSAPSGKYLTVEIEGEKVTARKLTGTANSYAVNYTPKSKDVKIIFLCGNTPEDLVLYGADEETVSGFPMTPAALESSGITNTVIPGLTIEISDVSLAKSGDVDVDGDYCLFKIEHYYQINGQYVRTAIGDAVAPKDTTVDAVARDLYKVKDGYKIPDRPVVGQITSIVADPDAPIEDRTLKLYYQAKTYNVTYVLNNSDASLCSHNTASYTYGVGRELHDPIYSGRDKVFDGWYLDEEFTQSLTYIAGNRTDDITLYAKWRDPVPGDFDDDPDPIEVDRVSLEPSTLTLEKGESADLKAIITPADATTRLSWKSGDDAVAKVDNGKVTAVAKGNTTITVTTDNGKTAICKVTVTDGSQDENQGGNQGGNPGGNPGGIIQTVEVTSVALTPSSLTLKKGGVATLTPVITPANATNKNVTYTSSNQSVATVDAAGKVTALEKGTAVITVTTADGNKTATCTVTVTIPSTKVKVNTKKLYIVKNKKVKVKATMTPRNSTDKVEWTSSDKTIATVTTGKPIVTITAKKVSSKPATITVKTESGKTAKIKVYVVKKAKKAKSIKLNKKTLNLAIGEIYDLVPTVKTKSTDTIKWKSSNKKVVSVDAFGMLMAKKGGTVTITAKTSSGKKATCKVTVKVKATKVKLSKTKLSLKVGKTATLKAKLTPTDATDTLRWSSSNKKVVSVDKNGKITAVKKGTATITVKTSGKKTAKCKVTVK